MKKGASYETISDGDGERTNLQYMDGKLYYSQNGTLQAYDVSNRTKQEITAGESGIASNAKVFDNGKKAAVLWSAPCGDGTNAVYASILTKEGYSEPAALYTAKQTISYLSAELLSDNSWQLVMNMGDGKETDLHSMVFVEKADTAEITADGIRVENAAVDGGNTEITYAVKNTGQQTVDHIFLKVCTEDGAEKTVKIPVSILPGETVCETAEIDLGTMHDAEKASVSIYADGQAETAENTKEVVLAQTDLKVSTAMTETGEDICIAATVENASDVLADAVLTLYGDVERTKVLERILLGRVAKDKNAAHTFYLNKGELTQNNSHAYYLPVVVTSDKTDVNEDNNEEIVVAYGKDTTADGGNTTQMADDTKGQPIKVSTITITGISGKIAAGKSIKLKTETAPANAADKSLTWVSSNPDYATVDAAGKVTAKKAGAGKTVTITATAKDGSKKSASYQIKIMKDAVKKIRLSAASKTVTAGKSIKIKATVITTGKKANKTLQWTSSNTKYATVKNGKVKTTKAAKGKTVTITAMSTDGTNKKAKWKLKIK